jgi:hypothetical protein
MQADALMRFVCLVCAGLNISIPNLPGINFTFPSLDITIPGVPNGGRGVYRWPTRPADSANFFIATWQPCHAGLFRTVTASLSSFGRLQVANHCSAEVLVNSAKQWLGTYKMHNKLKLAVTVLVHPA